MEQSDFRKQASSEVHSTCMDTVDVRGFDRYTKEEAREQLDKNWTNLCTVHVSSSETTGRVEEAVEELERLGYIANVELKDEGFVIEVELTSEVDERLDY